MQSSDVVYKVSISEDVDRKELESLGFSVSWSSTNTMKRKFRDLVKKYLTHKKAPSILSSIFIYILFYSLRYDRVIRLHEILNDMHPVLGTLLSNVAVVCRCLQHRNEERRQKILMEVPASMRDKVMELCSVLENYEKSPSRKVVLNYESSESPASSTA